MAHAHNPSTWAAEAEESHELGLHHHEFKASLGYRAKPCLIKTMHGPGRGGREEDLKKRTKKCYVDRFLPEYKLLNIMMML